MAVIPSQPRQSIAPGFMTMAAKSKLDAEQAEKDRKSREGIASSQNWTQLGGAVLRGVMNVGAAALKSKMDAGYRKELYEQQAPERGIKRYEFMFKEDMTIPKPTKRTMVEGVSRQVLDPQHAAIPYWVGQQRERSMGQVLPIDKARKAAEDSYEAMAMLHTPTHMISSQQFITPAYQKRLKAMLSNAQYQAVVQQFQSLVGGKEGEGEEAKFVSGTLHPDAARQVIQGTSAIMLDVPTTQSIYDEARKAILDYKTAGAMRIGIRNVTEKQQAIKHQREFMKGALLLWKIKATKEIPSSYAYDGVSSLSDISDYAATNTTQYAALMKDFDVKIAKATGENKKGWTNMKVFAVDILKGIREQNFTYEQVQALLNPEKSGKRWSKAFSGDHWLNQDGVQRVWNKTLRPMVVPRLRNVGKGDVQRVAPEVLDPHKDPKAKVVKRPAALNTKFRTTISTFARKAPTFKDALNAAIASLDKQTDGAIDAVGGLRKRLAAIPDLRRLKANMAPITGPGARVAKDIVDMVEHNLRPEPGALALVTETSKSNYKTKLSAFATAIRAKPPEDHAGYVEAFKAELINGLPKEWAKGKRVLRKVDQLGAWLLSILETPGGSMTTPAPQARAGLGQEAGEYGKIITDIANMRGSRESKIRKLMSALS